MSTKSKRRTVPRERAEFITIKIPIDFYRWVKAEATREGRFLGVQLEHLVSAGLGGQEPWRAGDKAVAHAL